MTETQTISDSPAGSRLRILIVEDAPLDAELMVRALERDGLAVYAERVEDAPGMLAALETGLWDVVLTDHTLPGFSSREALTLVREHSLDLPVIVVSGNLGEELAVELIHQGVADYLLKDRLARLGSAVRRALQEAGERRARLSAEQDVRQREQELQALVAASQRLGATLDLAETYRAIYEAVAALAPCDTLYISHVDPVTQLITREAGWVDGHAEDISSYPPVPLAPEGCGVQSVAIRSGTSQIFNDYARQLRTAVTQYYVDGDNRLSSTVRADARLPQACLVVPIKVEGAVTGVIQALSYARDAYSERHVRMVEALAAHAGAALANARLYQQAQGELARRSRAEQALQESQRMLTLQNRIAQIMLTVPGEGAYGDVLQVMREVTESPYGVICYLDEDGTAVMAALSHGVWEQCRVPDKPIRFPRATWGDTIWARAMLTRTSVISNAPGHVPEGHVPIHRGLAVPILFQGEAIGHFLIANKAEPYGVADAALVEQVAAYIAPVLQARLERDRREIARRAAEQALQESRRDLAAVIDNSQDSIWSLDRNYRLLVGNRVYLANMHTLHGVDLQPGDSVLAPSTPSDVRMEWYHYYDRALGGESFAVEMLHPSANPPRMGDLRLSPIRQPDGSITGAVAQWHDITRRKQAERALRESEELYRSLFANMLNGFSYCQMHYDDQGEPCDFTYLSVNRAFEPLTGLKDVVGKKASEVIPGIRESDAALLKKYGQVATTGQPEVFETYVEALQMWLSVSAYSPRPGYFVAVFDVITERKRAEEALRESEGRYRRLAENARDLIYRVRLVPERRFEYVSPAATQITGYTPEEHYADPDLGFKLVHPDDIPILMEASQGHVSPNQPIVLRWVRKDGSIIWTEQRNVPILDDSGQVVALEGIARDITARKRAEEALRESEAQYHQLFEMESDAIVLVDNADGRILATNSAAVALYGFTRDELLTMHNHDLSVEPEETQRVTHGMPLISDQLVTIPLRYHHKRDGTVFPVEITGRFFEWHGRSVHIAAIRDISERQRAEEALRESEAQYHRLTENIQDYIMRYDRQFRHVYANTAAIAITGRIREEYIGKTHREMGFPEHLCALWERTIQRVFDTAEPQRVESAWENAGGSIILDWRAAPEFAADGHVETVLVLARDITALRRGEETLRQREHLLDRIFDILPVGLWLADKTGALVRSNATGRALWGAEPLVGPERYGVFKGRRLPSGQEIAPDDWALAHTMREGAVIQGEMIEIDAFDGQKRVILNSTAPVLDDTGQVEAAIVVNQDVTELVRAQEALRESEQRFRTVADWTYDWEIWSLPGRKTIYVSPSAERISGYTPDEFLADSQLLSRIIHPQDRAMFEAHHTQSRELDPSVHTLEFRIITRQGQIRWINHTCRPAFSAKGEYLGRRASHRDITEQRRTQEERERLMSAIEQAEESVIVTDPRGAIQYVNPAFERITGYSRAEVLGRTPSILKSGAQDAAFYKQLWDTITSGQTWHGRFVNRRKDGTTFTEEATISPARDASGVITNYVSVKRDITESLVMQQEQERLQAQLLQSQRMESIGRLAGGVAHDFNNMLGVILGNAELAMTDIDPSTQLYHDLHEIFTAAQRSADLTRQLLAFARRQTVSPKVLDLNETVSGMLKMLGRLIGEDVALIWRPGHDLWRVRIDPSQVDQVLANLCTNARDAIGGVGTVTIETDNATLDEHYCALHAGFRPGEYVTLAVSDDGAGMDHETLSHLFEPFFTTKEVGKGTGLGLATIYGIVKQNDGHIHVYSEIGKGSIFRIYIPRHQAPAALPSDTSIAQPVGGDETILIVEDERAVLNLGRVILMRLGYTVLTAESPSEGLDLARTHEGAIHLLISDVVMPGMNGRELVQRITAVRPEIKCLYMSGYPAEAIAHHGVLDEGVLFLQKPYTTRDLAAKVREALDG